MFARWERFVQRGRDPFVSWEVVLQCWFIEASHLGRKIWLHEGDLLYHIADRLQNVKHLAGYGEDLSYHIKTLPAIPFNGKTFPFHRQVRRTRVVLRCRFTTRPISQKYGEIMYCEEDVL